MLKKNSEMMPKVLILDDEEPIRQMIRQLLENNYSCTSAANVANARECLKDSNFEVILCDINMPGESGIDFIRYVMAEYPDTAVIMVTGVNDPEVAETALEIGAYGYIIKPFRRSELIINIQNSLRRRELEITDRCYREDLERTVAQRTTKLRKVLEGIIHACLLYTSDAADE